MFCSWMTWVWPTAAFFISLALVGMTIWKFRRPDGSPFRGIRGLEAAHRDRLFNAVHGIALILLDLLELVGSRTGAALGNAATHETPGYRWA